MTQTKAARKPETLGRRLASQRALHGLTQQEVADKVGTSQAYISVLENDQATAPPITTIQRLAELFGVTIDYLVNGVAA